MQITAFWHMPNAEVISLIAESERRIAEETRREIAAATVSAQRELEALIRNIDTEAMDIKRDIEKLRRDVDNLRERPSWWRERGAGNKV